MPNCTYLKLKLSGPNRVITVSGTFEHAYVSSREYFDLATTVANSAELGQLRAATAECRADPGRPSQAPAFVSTDETKMVVVDDADPTNTVRVGSQLSVKLEHALVNFLRANKDTFAWKPSDMPGIPREVAEHELRILPGSKPVQQ